MTHTLTQEEARDQLGLMGACPTCLWDIFRAYCRDCGEYFDYGHDPECSAQATPVHNGHRAQHQSDIVGDLIAGKI